MGVCVFEDYYQALDYVARLHESHDLIIQPSKNRVVVSKTDIVYQLQRYEVDPLVPPTILMNGQQKRFPLRVDWVESE
jgi:hypothetical protein